jgi:hypothetical protein
MTFETYWLVIAPAMLLGLSAVAWAGLWITRSRKPGHQTPEAKPHR